MFTHVSRNLRNIITGKNIRMTARYVCIPQHLFDNDLFIIFQAIVRLVVHLVYNLKIEKYRPESHNY